MKICLVGVVLYGWTGKWTDMMKLIVAFCKFVRTPKNCQVCVCVCVCMHLFIYLFTYLCSCV